MSGGRKRIGIMGGSFDPIHIGHLILGEAAHRQFHLDKVLFMPAGNPPHKPDRTGRAGEEDRTRMVSLAIESNPHFELALTEIHKKGFSYTYKTLETLKAEHPDTDYFFVIGADSLLDFDTWMNPQRIVDACSLVVATRNQIAPEQFDAILEKRRHQYHGTFLKLDTPNLDISSRHIRDIIRKGESVKYYLPDPVIDYIETHALYRSEDEED